MREALRLDPDLPDSQAYNKLKSKTNQQSSLLFLQIKKELDLAGSVLILKPENHPSEKARKGEN